MAVSPRIDLITTVPSAEEVTAQLSPAVNQWIMSSFSALNEVQLMSIPRIIANKNTLVMAPTGAGKTLAAFLGIISELYHLEKTNGLEKQIYALYVSPLKALNNDIHKNLEIPLSDIKDATGTSITVAKRTGDTPTKERQRLLRHPPHILITTPESLGLMLAAPKFKERLRHIRWLIVDEIHSLADNKRGTHLALSLERLEYYLKRPLTRIGLSATVEPPELIGQYLVGSRDIELGMIDRGGLRELDIEVITPTRNLVHAPFSLIEKRHLEYLQEYLENNRTILIFTNTRHLSERLVVELREHVKEEWQDKIAVHHGSLDKQVRLDVENSLKNGEMKAVFTSTSLEMGIDIGSIDLTVQLGSPKTVRALLQRIGRSGHSQELISKGKVLVFGRDDLLECVVIAKLAKEGNIDAIRIPEAPADVLIQILVGMALEQKWDFHEAYQVISTAYPYRNLTYTEFLTILRTAADPTGTEDSWKYGHLWMDEAIEEFGRRKSGRQAYLQNIGTIPDVTTIDVVLQGFRTMIGQISEKFAERLQTQDIFVLGGKSYEFVRSVGNKILVENAPGRVPTVPSWGGEAQTRTLEVSEELDHLLQNVVAKLEVSKTEAVDWIISRYPVGEIEAEVIVDYIIEQQGLAPVPGLDRLIVESYTDPTGSTNLLILMLYGLEINQALAQALATLVSEKINNNVGVLATDNGILLRIPPGFEFEIGPLFDRLAEISLEDYIMRSLRDTEMFKVRFRHAAARSLMILRRWGRRSISVSQQQRTARWLLKNLTDEMVVVKEAYREVLHDTYNLVEAENVISRLQTGDITVSLQPPAEVPSSFTHELLLNGELDVVMMENRRNLLASLHQQVISRILPELAAYESILDQKEVEEYFAAKLSKTLPEDMRIKRLAEFPMSADKIAYGTRIWDRPDDEIATMLDHHPEVIRYGRDNFTTYDQLALIGAIHDQSFWTQFSSSDESIDLARQRSDQLSPDSGWEHLILRRLEYAGPQTSDQLAEQLDTTSERIDPILRRLQRSTAILRGKFTTDQNQYLRSEDREQLSRVNQPDELITEDRLKNYRLYRMRLLRRNRSDKMTVIDYLRENGPARDPIELVSRLDQFDWRRLRALLTDRSIYFGRFLGRRLVFIHHRDLEDFVRVTRDPETQPDGIAHEVLLTLAERPGLTQRELSQLLNYPYSTISDALKLLEDQLYISRTGFELTLTHGGFPNPRYIPLPTVSITDSSYQQAVINVIRKCCHWYGPLTVNDLLRITRLPYPVIEEGLDASDLQSQLLLNTTYYGHDYSFDTLYDLDIGLDELDELYLLSPLDPYFYMTSGSFRRDFLPRQTRLSIIHEGLPKGYIEISIPDKDILQVINLQLSKRRIQNANLVKKVGVAIHDLAKLAYQTPVVFIEEINYKAANHPDIKLAVTTLQEIGYQLQIDHLVIGTSQKHDFSKHDIIITRQINSKQQLEKRYKDLSALFEANPIITTTNVLQMLDLSPSQAQLLVSHHLRKGQIHHKSGKLYRDDIFRALFGREKTFEHPVFDALTSIHSRNELTQKLDMKSRDVADQLYEFVQNGVVEVISPFAKINEYRQVPMKSMSLARQLQILSMYFIRSKGPLNFAQLIELIQDYHPIVSRTQLLITLTTLLNTHEILSAAVHQGERSSKEVMYFTASQAEILGDPTKTKYLEGWLIYETEEQLFELDTADTHVMTYDGQIIASFSYQREQDSGVITDLNLIQLDVIKNRLVELVKEIEQFVFSKGMRRLELAKFGGAIATYWEDL